MAMGTNASLQFDQFLGGAAFSGDSVDGGDEENAKATIMFLKDSGSKDSFLGAPQQTPPRPAARSFLQRRRAPPQDPEGNESTTLHLNVAPRHFQHDENRAAPWFPMALDDDDVGGRRALLSGDVPQLPNTTFVRPLFTPPRSSSPANLEMSVTPGTGSTRQDEPLHSEEVVEPPEVMRVTGQGRAISFMDLVLGDHIPYLPEVLDDEPSNPGMRIQMKSSRMEFANLFLSRGWPAMHSMT